MKKIVIITLLLTMHSTYASEFFGRLFMTPSERKLLDDLRGQQVSVLKKTIREIEKEEKTTDKKSIAPLKKTLERSVKLSGIIVREDGREQVWVNGQLLRANNPLVVKVKEKNNAALLKHSLLDNNAAAKAVLKVGQKWLPASGEVVDVYDNKTQ